MSDEPENAEQPDGFDEFRTDPDQWRQQGRYRQNNLGSMPPTLDTPAGNEKPIQLKQGSVRSDPMVWPIQNEVDRQALLGAIGGEILPRLMLNFQSGFVSDVGTIPQHGAFEKNDFEGNESGTPGTGRTDPLSHVELFTEIFWRPGGCHGLAGTVSEPRDCR